MKKLTISILAIMIACPSFANIAKDNNSPTCDNTTIGATSGTTNLEAQWTANTINLDWYDGNTKLTVGSTSATCTYDGAITLPSTPTVPTGYTFGGWKVRGATVPTIQCPYNASWDGTTCVCERGIYDGRDCLEPKYVDDDEEDDDFEFGLF